MHPTQHNSPPLALSFPLIISRAERAEFSQSEFNILRVITGEGFHMSAQCEIGKQKLNTGLGERKESVTQGARLEGERTGSSG